MSSDKEADHTHPSKQEGLGGYSCFSEQCADLWKSLRFQAVCFYDSKELYKRWMLPHCLQSRLVSMCFRN